MYIKLNKTNLIIIFQFIGNISVEIEYKHLKGDILNISLSGKVLKVLKGFFPTIPLEFCRILLQLCTLGVWVFCQNFERFIFCFGLE